MLIHCGKFLSGRERE
jgi:flagellar biosynthesis GTPase FlhF